MTRDQTPTESSYTCSSCGENLLDRNVRYDSDTGLKSFYCEECDITTVKEGVGARMDRMAQGETLDEIHDNLPEGVRKAIQDALPPSVEDGRIRYVDDEGNVTEVDTTKVIEMPDPDEESCVFPDCPETDNLTHKEGTGKLCPLHHDVLTTDLNDPEERAALWDRTAKDSEERASRDDL